MAEASEVSVLGNFENAEITAQGVTSRFYRKDDGYYVRTDGPDGEMQDYLIRYTFGWYPLQQYLVEFPGGRLQSLGLAWDSREKAQGGQRWFHLYPDQAIDHEHALHWTGREQNWNYQCAECHSTNLQRAYDPVVDSYNTVWSEIDVACEACHGPGSDHLAWAERLASGSLKKSDDQHGILIDLKDRDGGHWLIDEQTGRPHRTLPRGNRQEVEMCARCHSRRGQIWADYTFGKPLLDTHRLALLSDQLYHPDGQIKDEVYVYGSFLQSRMYGAGVTCTDCHEPHSQQLRAEGNALCGRCHLPARYDSAAHHHHETGTKAAACVSCHMPERTYMVVDERADHSLRVPRPDLSASLGVPNACNTCHTDRTAEWASHAVQTWYPDSHYRGRHAGQVLHAARNGDPSAFADLLALVNDSTQPGILVATAIDQLAERPQQRHLTTIGRRLQDRDPLVRAAALRFLEHADLKTRVELGWEMLDDPIRTVRLDAALLLAPLMRQRLPENSRARLQQAMDEYKAAQKVNAERPESHLNLGLFAAAQGKGAESEQEYRTAIRIAPDFTPAYINLADLYRQMSRDEEGRQVLKEGISRAPSNPSLHHALGLLQVRQNRLDAALAELEKAAELAPELGRYAYVYALALDKAQEKERAVRILEQLLQREPRYVEATIALVNLHLGAGDLEAARRRLDAAKRQSPGDDRLEALEQQLPQP